MPNPAWVDRAQGAGAPASRAHERRARSATRRRSRSPSRNLKKAVRRRRADRDGHRHRAGGPLPGLLRADGARADGEGRTDAAAGAGRGDARRRPVHEGRQATSARSKRASGPTSSCSTPIRWPTSRTRGRSTRCGSRANRSPGSSRRPGDGCRSDAGITTRPPPMPPIRPIEPACRRSRHGRLGGLEADLSSACRRRTAWSSSRRSGTARTAASAI